MRKLSSDLSKVLKEIIGEWDCPNIYTGCSGSLSLERLVASFGRFNIHAHAQTFADVVLATYLSGTWKPVTLRNEARSEFGWLDEYLKNDIQSVATVMLCEKMLKGISHRDAAFDRALAGYRAQWDSLHEKMSGALRKDALRLNSVSTGDTGDFIASAPKDAGVVLLPVKIPRDQGLLSVFHPVDGKAESPRPRKGVPAPIARKVAEKFGGRPGEVTDAECRYCGTKGSIDWTRGGARLKGNVRLVGLEFEHMIPLSRGGTTETDNLTISCPKCNVRKADRASDEWDGAAEYKLPSESSIIANVLEHKFGVVVTDREVETGIGKLRSVVGSCNPPMRVYTNDGSRRYIAASSPKPGPEMRVLSAGMELCGAPSIRRLPVQVFYRLREEHLNIRIDTGSVCAAWGIFVGDYCVGAFAFSYNNHMPDAPHAVHMTADFAVGPTDYPRLSKLVLIALLSEDARLALQQSLNRRINAIRTAVFSDHAVSMKYRNLFRLRRREPVKDGPHSYHLHYEAQAGQWPLPDGYAMWVERYGERRI